MATALIIGYGSIAKSVYSPQLKKHGYIVYTLDPYAKDTNFSDISEIKPEDYLFDLVIICTPNYTHYPLAKHIVKCTKALFIEKPGFESAEQLIELKKDNPNVHIQLVNNVMHRTDIPKWITNPYNYFGYDTIEKVEINWLNKNRIPNPGSWFTDKSKAFGGVAQDLMPHLISYAYMIGSNVCFEKSTFYKRQTWRLENIESTDYGFVDKKGIYDVEDYAELSTYFEYQHIHFPIILKASWKEGYDDQSIKYYLKDGTILKWEFGLCPADAYGNMLVNKTNNLIPHNYSSVEVHKLLDKFKG